MSIIYRPKSNKARIHSSDEFELCYLRHKYFRKTLYNPSPEDMKPYTKIVENLARHTYMTYRHLFHSIGFDQNDVTSIGNIHLVSFLGLFSLESVPAKYHEFADMYKKLNGTQATTMDFLNKNRANFTMFLKQRMEDVVRVCRQKAKNIKGTIADERHFFCGTRKPPQILKNLLENYHKYGYKKIDLSSFRTIKKKAKNKNDVIFRHNKKWYIAVPIEQKKLELIDFSGSGLDPYDNIHNMNPEQILFHRQEEDYWERKKESFRKQPKNSKVKMLIDFVKDNAKNPSLTEEVRTAKKMLRKMRVEIER
jgi:hypothetical protein